jgi:hypothetical protein
MGQTANGIMHGYLVGVGRQAGVFMLESIQFTAWDDKATHACSGRYNIQ